MGQLNQNDILSLELVQSNLCSQKLLRALPWLAAVALIVFAASCTQDRSLVLQGFQLEYLNIAILLLVPLLIGLTINWNAYLGTKMVAMVFRQCLKVPGLKLRELTVGAAEMGYKALASRPSRFVGRML